MEFRIVKGNIVDAKTDAIVLPANTHLKEGSGVSAAIFEAAGRRNLKKACEKIGYCEVGAAVPTLAYDLSAKYIIHTVTPRWRDGESGEYDLLSSAYLSALELSDVMDCESLTFPLLSSGNNGFDMNLAAEIAIKSIEAYAGKNLKDVVLVVYGSRAERVFSSLAYTVSILPPDLQKEEEKYRKRREVGSQIKSGVQKVFDDQLKKGIAYFQDEKNREKIIRLGVQIVKAVMETMI